MVGQDWHSTKCYGCGPENEHGLGAEFRFHTETGEVRFSYDPKPFEIGAPGFLHGGVTAALLDEAQGVLCFHIGHAIMTEQLNIKYHKAIPLDKPVDIRCWITSVRRRRIYTRATIHSKEGDLYASSRAAWYLLPERLMERMFSLKQHPEWAARTKGTLEANRKRAREIRRRIRKEKQKQKPVSKPV